MVVGARARADGGDVLVEGDLDVLVVRVEGGVDSAGGAARAGEDDAAGELGALELAGGNQRAGEGGEGKEGEDDGGLHFGWWGCFENS